MKTKENVHEHQADTVETEDTHDKDEEIVLVLRSVLILIAGDDENSEKHTEKQARQKANDQQWLPRFFGQHPARNVYRAWRSIYGNSNFEI